MQEAANFLATSTFLDADNNHSSWPLKPFSGELFSHCLEEKRCTLLPGVALNGRDYNAAVTFPKNGMRLALVASWTPV